MGLGVDRAIAELIRDGDPRRSIAGLQTLEAFELYDSATVSARRIFLGESPPEPDESCTVYLDGGGPPVQGSHGQSLGNRPGITIRSRSNSYADAQTRAYAIAKILEEYDGTVRGIPFGRITANTDPISLGRDREQEGGRWVWTQSFATLTKRFDLT